MTFILTDDWVSGSSGLSPALRAARDGRDALTGALSRDRLLEELVRVLAAAQRYKEPAAVCVLDLDHLRLINDAHGHRTGDRVLLATAAALQARLRATDSLGRIGADEFAVVLPRTDVAAARAVAADLLVAVRDRVRTAVGGSDLRLTASAGVTAVEVGEDLSATAAMTRAGLAMQAAKSAGRDRLVVAQPGVDGQERVRESLAWAQRVHDALESGGLDLHAQPIVGLGPETAPPRYELLVRLRAEPDLASRELVATAERFGQIQAVDGWVVTRALEILDRTEDLVLHVNLAAASLGDTDLMAFVERCLRAAGLAPGRLVFEVTETAAIADVAAARSVLERLRATGCGLALDDFGAGFASFAYLKHLPFDVLKIDGEFVRDLPRSLVDRLAVEAMTGVARGLGVSTVAEYVSDDETVELLRELGVTHAQGFHLGAPQPCGELFG